MSDYYKTLGIDNSATKDQIKKAYRKLSLNFILTDQMETQKNLKK